MPSWFHTGGFKHLDVEQDRLDRLSGPPEFFMRVGEKKDLVFLDDEPLFVYRHAYKVANRFEMLTCLRNSEYEAVCCERLGERSRMMIGYLSVVDCSEYQDRNGNKHQFEMKLFPAKMGTLKKLRRKKEEAGSFAGFLCTVARDMDKDPSCGGDFTMKRPTDLSKLYSSVYFRGKRLADSIELANKDIKLLDKLKAQLQLALDEKGAALPKIVPYNYVELLKPMTAEDVKVRLSGASVSVGFGNAPGGAAPNPSGEIPF
jgi:hypothetical protein